MGQISKWEMFYIFNELSKAKHQNYGHFLGGLPLLHGCYDDGQILHLNLNSICINNKKLQILNWIIFWNDRVFHT